MINNKNNTFFFDNSYNIIVFKKTQYVISKFSVSY